jgi:hypothetical protein
MKGNDLDEALNCWQRLRRCNEIRESTSKWKDDTFVSTVEFIVEGNCVKARIYKPQLIDAVNAEADILRTKLTLMGVEV